MGGGSIQLSAWGSQNKYLMGNPALTFFKKVYKTHSNFSIESIAVSLNRTDANIFQPTILKAKIPRSGDLVSQIYLVFELPPILSDSFTRFRWVENIGEAIIDNVTISIGNVVVDRQSGEFMHVYNHAHLPSFRREMYNKMIGNITALNNPFKEQVLEKIYKDNAIRVTKIYPEEGSAANPTLPAHKCFVPLQFWFNREVSSAIPIVALQYMEVEVTIELRPIIEVYQLQYYLAGTTIAEYQAPNLDNPKHHIQNFVVNEFRRYMRMNTLLDIQARLEVNYVFLDKEERTMFVHRPLEYLIEQTTQVERFKLVEHNVIDIKLQNLVKDLFWVFRRTDANAFNKWFDFMDGAKNIMVNARFLFNGIPRMEDKEPQYFNYLIPFQHYQGDPKEGVYIFTFALDPKNAIVQPSGSCNFSRIEKFQFACKLIVPPPTTQYAYDLMMFASSYNILKIHGGIASLAYSL